MNNDYCKHVNVFLGCDPFDGKKPKGLAAKWKPIKTTVGNTHPGSVLPFGKMSCLAYSGGYSTGYGNSVISTYRRARIPRMFKFLQFRGFSHLHHSGAGFVDFFYNYALTSPFVGELGNRARPEQILSEYACPGYYSCHTDSTTAECTVTHSTAFHRFELNKQGNARVAIDFSFYGLNHDIAKLYTTSSVCDCTIVGNAVLCQVEMFGIPVYFAATARNATAISLWKGSAEIGDTTIFENNPTDSFGVCFDFEGNTAETILSLSFRSREHALECLSQDSTLSFEDVKTAAYTIWNDRLSAIEIDSTTENKELLYSCLYHSMVKPAVADGESLYGVEGDCVFDLVTMWDMYKTELPLINTICPDIGRKTANFLVSYAKKYGYIRNSFLVSNDERISMQARFLGDYALCDAYYHGLCSADDIYGTSIIERKDNAEYASIISGAQPQNMTFVLDTLEADAAIAAVARANGQNEYADTLMRGYPLIGKAFSAKTGLLKRKSIYYEGNHLNYSFRLFSNTQMRLGWAGGKDRLQRQLDYFFGYRYPQIRYGRFEGFGNETDMETPYSYHYCDNHDRLAEIIDAYRHYCIHNSRGGLCGNNDTGALTSAYVWNSLGIFPVSGQDKMIIGTPLYSKATLMLSKGQFCIIKEGKGIYVQSAVLNGKQLDKLEFCVTDMMQGGTLVITTCTEKTGN